MPVIPAIVGQDQPGVPTDLAAPLAAILGMSNVPRMRAPALVPVVPDGARQIGPRPRLGACHCGEERDQNEQVFHGISLVTAPVGPGTFGLLASLDSCLGVGAYLHLLAVAFRRGDPLGDLPHP